MPRRNRNRKGRRRATTRRNNMGFVPNSLRYHNLPATTMTLATTYTLTSGVLGTNGSVTTFNWNFLKDTVGLSHIYRYFEVVGFKLEVTLATTTAATDSFNELAVGFLPINYITEGVISTSATPGDSRSVLVLPGSVNAQPGASNKGRWFANEFKQQFSTADAFSTTLNRAMGSLIWYADDVGISETVGFINLFVNCRFYGREFYNLNPTFTSSREPAVTAPGNLSPSKKK